VKRIFFLILLLLSTISCGLSQRQVHAQAANDIAVAANGALPILLERYELAGDKAIAKANTEAEAEAAIAQIKADWKPVWDAWETLRITQDAWATALKDDGDTAATLKALGEAYCGLTAVWPKHIPVMPLDPLQCEAPVTP